MLFQVAAASTLLRAVEGLLVFIGIKAAFVGLDVLRNLWINYWCWRHRPDVQVRLVVVLLSGFIELFLSLCATFGRWKCLIFYVPLVPMRTGLVKRMPGGGSISAGGGGDTQ